MGFSLPQLNTCCCGCTLRTGTLILLWLTVVCCILQLFAAPYATTSMVPPDGSSKPSPSTGDRSKPITVSNIVATIITLIVSGVGLYGVYKENHSFLIPYLAWELIYVIILFVIAVVGTVINVALMVTFTITFLIAFYFWLVVYSHYRVLKGTARPIQA